MQDQAIDDFNDLSVWTAVTSGLAELVISSDQGPLGKVMRLDFDFKGSGGFVVARRAMTLDLVAPFAFHWRWRGLAPANQFEFKLADATGQNVWWFHRDALEFPADWQTLRIGHEDIEFAWGPSWGEPLQQLGALEFAIAAGPGGRGTIWIEALQFEDGRCLPEPLALASSSLPDHGPELALATHPGRGWLSATAPGGGHWYRLDFQVERPYGGLVIDWWPDRAPSAFEVLASSDGQTWQRLYQALRAGARRSYIALPGGRSRYLQLNLPGSVVGILEIDVKPYDFSRSPITFFQALARAEGRGSHPRYFYGEQSYWTSVGVWDGVTRALINEEGLVEPDLGSFSLEPSLFWRGEWLTWAAATQKTQTLERNDLPIPSVTWTWADGRLTITAGATGAGDHAILLLRYRIENLGSERLPGQLFVAIRPFQVTPPWQAFRGLGGISPIHTLAYRDGVVWVNGEPGGGKPVIPLDAVPFGAAAFDQGGVIEALRQGELPRSTEIQDPSGQASGALAFAFDLAPGSARTFFIAVPFGTFDPATADLSAIRCLGAPDAVFEAIAAGWAQKLGAMEIRLPDRLRALTETFRTAAAHILINREGPALQPGPRRYTRSWIRDGAIMADALLRVGCGEEVRDYLRWYAGFQAVNGAIPCCVDREGPDWLAEHDSPGQFLHAIAEYARLTGDHALVIELWPAVLKTLDYLEGLRKTRLSPAFEASGKSAACYGLLPESVSHEGYLAHPVHAYWDDFWALRGLKDAVELAIIMGDTGRAEALRQWRDDFRQTLLASLRLTMAERQIDFLPGSVEWADCDPSATAVAVAPIDESHHLPASALARTFEVYLQRFRDCRADRVTWANYTPYEIRVIAALVRLGRREEAWELLAFFLSDRRPRAWNQWPEIAWHNPASPGHLGDVPHTWIGAEYMLAVVSLFAYEREADQSLVIAAGVCADWLNPGEEIVVRDLPTQYGRLSYRLGCDETYTWRLSIAAGLIVPPGGLCFQPPGDRQTHTLRSLPAEVQCRLLSIIT